MPPDARPPLWYWGIPLLAGALRMLPVWSLSFVAPPEGQTFLGVSYLPKDFLQYAAMSRQLTSDGVFPFYNPFTTEPQGSRFILLFHALVGLAARVTGASPIAAFEWSRIPVMLLFFAALWWFLRPVLEPRDRCAAAVLVGFAGGIDAFLRPLSPATLPRALDRAFRHGTSPLHGWSLFASFYNPLWIAGLTLALLVLRPLLFPQTRSPRALALSGVALVLLFFVHPYTALGVLGIVALRPVMLALFRERLPWRPLLVDAAVLGAALAVIGAISLWQLQDPVYRRSTGGVFGAESLSALWYPLTLGVLGALAVVGARRWIATRHPARAPILGWLAAVALLHWPPILNGYKFVFLLPLPVCILAAPMAREWASRARSGARTLVFAGLAGVLLFGGALAQTVDDVRTAPRIAAVSASSMQLVEALAAEPPAHALVPAGLGNFVPAFTSHRVWLGHWFLTPDYFVRAQLFDRFTTSRTHLLQFQALLRNQRIRYLVVPTERADFVKELLGKRIAAQQRHGGLELLTLAEPAGDAALVTRAFPAFRTAAAPGSGVRARSRAARAGAPRSRACSAG